MVSKKRKSVKKVVAKKAPPKKTVVKRGSTKQARLIEMLRRPQGATIEQIAKALDWQKHTVRGAIAGALKKKLGLKVSSTKETAGRVYRVTGSEQRASA